MAFALAKTLENNGGKTFNYIEVIGFIKDKEGVVKGVELLDKLTQEKVSIKAKCII